MGFKIDQLIKFGRSQCKSGYEYGGIRNYYIIHFVLKGKGEYKVGNRTWRLQTNDAFLIRPNEQHLYKADNKDPWEYMWFCFSGDISGTLNQLKIDEENLCSHIKGIEDIIYYFSKVERNTLYQKPAVHISNLGYIHLVLSHFLFEGSERLESQAKTEKFANNHVMGMSCYIEQNFMNPISVSDVIHYIQLDRSYASNLYKNTKRISLFDDIQARRVCKAIDLLKTSYSIKEITYICGFKSYQNFLSVFKNHIGVTPGGYRSSRCDN